jgi:3-phosphoshikimate 1-carboxyvinyltransferase
LFNRALIIQSFFESVQIKGFSNCEDVKHMQLALQQFRKEAPIFCGEAGTVIRFMALRVSRSQGEYFLKGSHRLLGRPQAEIQAILSQLGVTCDLQSDGLRIYSKGWNCPKNFLQVDQSQSSQFASAVVLNAWQLPFDLRIKIAGNLSQSYLQMTIHLCRSLGMKVFVENSEIWIEKNQKIQASLITLEPDYSSAAAVIAASVVGGECELIEMPPSVYQPDYEFLEILKKMQADVLCNQDSIVVKKSSRLKAVHADLSSCPDLFPVLAVLCATAEGTSKLYGAPHLKFKESNRIEKTAQLLQIVGFDFEVHKDGMSIFGASPKFATGRAVFDPENDHRMAMAAAVLRLYGFDLEIQNPEVVDKSFPEFWNCIEGKNV